MPGRGVCSDTGTLGGVTFNVPGGETLKLGFPTYLPMSSEPPPAKGLSYKGASITIKTQSYSHSLTCRSLDCLKMQGLLDLNSCLLIDCL